MITKETISEITQLIVADYHPDKVILFGSHATGNAQPDSDLDLLIISDREQSLPRRKRGLALLYKLRKYHFSKDLLFYTHAEIEKWKGVPAAFITEALKDGVILYAK